MKNERLPILDAFFCYCSLFADASILISIWGTLRFYRCEGFVVLWEKKGVFMFIFSTLLKIKMTMCKSWNCRMGDAVVVRVVETKRRSSEVSPWDGLPGTLVQKSVEFSEKRKESLRARYLYGIVFLLANLVAWCARDYGQKLSPLLHCKLRIPSPYCKRLWFQFWK